MSRIGKLPIVLPSGVKANIVGAEVLIEGPKGKLKFRLLPGISVVVEGNELVVQGSVANKQSKSNWGSARAHLNNMVRGVHTPWTRSLEMTGVGYTANLKGKTLVLTAGYSHDVVLEVPATVTCKTEKTKIELESFDLEVLAQFAAKVRKVAPPEPYLGKGIKYSDETVRRKAGKTGK